MDAGFWSMNANARESEARILLHEEMARQTYRMRLEAPALAARIVPGQFFMVRPFGLSDPLLGRPFALYDVWPQQGPPTAVEFGYITVGKMTRAMVDWPAGGRVRLWGPLGNGFPPAAPGRLLMVAGGIGQTPFLALGREVQGAAYGDPPRGLVPLAAPPRLLYGARGREYLAGLEDFSRAGIDVRVSTDDGSAGHHGLVTDLLEEELREAAPEAVYCCGPEAMMKQVASLCAAADVPCWLSLESPMACGIGACFSCVVKKRTPDGWDYRRSCVEGPVFAAGELEL